MSERFLSDTEFSVRMESRRSQMIKITSSHRSESDTGWRALDMVEFKTLSVRYKDMG